MHILYTHTKTRWRAEREVLERERMEGRKQATSYSSSSSLTSELFGSKESSSSSGIFGSIFAPSSKVLLVSVYCFFVLIYWVYMIEICDCSIRFWLLCFSLRSFLFCISRKGKRSYIKNFEWIAIYVLYIAFFVMFAKLGECIFGELINASHRKKWIK